MRLLSLSLSPESEQVKLRSHMQASPRQLARQVPHAGEFHASWHARSLMQWPNYPLQKTATALVSVHRPVPYSTVPYCKLSLELTSLIHPGPASASWDDAGIELRQRGRRGIGHLRAAIPYLQVPAPAGRGG